METSPKITFVTRPATADVKWGRNPVAGAIRAALLDTVTTGKAVDLSSYKHSLYSRHYGWFKKRGLQLRTTKTGSGVVGWVEPRG